MNLQEKFELWESLRDSYTIEDVVEWLKQHDFLVYGPGEYPSLFAPMEHHGRRIELTGHGGSKDHLSASFRYLDDGKSTT